MADDERRTGDRRAGMTDVEIHEGGTGQKLNLVDSQAQEIERLRGIVKMGERVVADFLPNIGQCALQNYGELNTFCIDAALVPEPGGDT